MLVPSKFIIIFVYLFTLISASSLCYSLIAAEPTDPIPTPWPEQFHSTLIMNNSEGVLQTADLWYDWPRGRNLFIFQYQLGKVLYDLEWNNRTSYMYTLDSNQECSVLHFPVGMVRPNWLAGATYLGQKYMDGFLCNAWEKIDFVWYYEDVATKRPVYWIFSSGSISHVMTFEVGRVLEDSKWQAPSYCFKELEMEKKSMLENLPAAGSIRPGSLMREFKGIGDGEKIYA